MRRRVDFARINAAALARLPEVLRHLLPNGYLDGAEYVARNPTRDDRNPGSFKINIHTGHWADFATDDKGGDPISLAAYVWGVRQSEAALQLANLLGVS